MLVRVLDLWRGGDIDRFACATAAAVCCSSVGRGIFRPKMKLFPIKIATLCISEYTKKSVKQSDIANTERFWYMLQIFSGSAKLGRNKQNSDISLSDITKFDCIPWSVRNYHNASKGYVPGSAATSKSHFRNENQPICKWCILASCTNRKDNYTKRFEIQGVKTLIPDWAVPCELDTIDSY